MTHTLRWFAEGNLHKKISKRIGEQASIDQMIGDETPEEILEELRLQYGKHYSGALSYKPQVRLLLAGSDEKQTKPVSAIVRWLRGDQRASLTEFDEASNSLPLYLDFVADAGGPGQAAAAPAAAAFKFKANGGEPGKRPHKQIPCQFQRTMNQGVRQFYARDVKGNYLMKSDPDFWHAAEDALVAKVRLEAHASGASITDQQIRNAATSTVGRMHGHIKAYEEDSHQYKMSPAAHELHMKQAEEWRTAFQRDYQEGKTPPEFQGLHDQLLAIIKEQTQRATNGCTKEKKKSKRTHADAGEEAGSATRRRLRRHNSKEPESAGNEGNACQEDVEVHLPDNEDNMSPKAKELHARVTARTPGNGAAAKRNATKDKAKAAAAAATAAAPQPQKNQKRNGRQQPDQQPDQQPKKKRGRPRKKPAEALEEEIEEEGPGQAAAESHGNGEESS